ncbi:MAG: hypothetical protein AAFR59_01315, partial [Bacteroidota bacterium]
LMENGQLFYQSKIEGEWEAYENLKKRTTKRLFAQMDDMGWDQLEVNQPGNMTYFVELQNQTTQHRVTWGSEKAEVSPEVSKLFQQLMQAAQSSSTQITESQESGS